jgi:hypothetical protein
MCTKKKTAFSTKNKQTNKQAEKKGVAKINEKQSMMLKDSNCVFLYMMFSWPFHQIYVG